MSQLLRECRFLLNSLRAPARDPRRVAVAIPTFNRVADLLPALPLLLADERVAEVVVLDDASDEGVYRELAERLAPFSAKVRLRRNARNLGAFANKVGAVGLCRQEWVILLDSDNRITRSYLDRLFALAVWSPRVIYCPERAGPFDYRLLSGCTLDLEAVRRLLAEPPGFLNAFLGTGNYFVHARSYCELLEPRGAGVGSLVDVNYANYLWLRNGGVLHVLPGLDYRHRVHDGSLFKNTREASNVVTRELNDALASGSEYRPPERVLTGGGEAGRGA